MKTSWTAQELAVTAAIELALDVAYHDGDERDLAVAAEAYSLVGFHDGSINVSHGGGMDTVLGRVQAARKYRPRQRLRADARGMVQAFTVLANCDLITHAACSEATSQRWLARGGHDYAGVENSQQEPK